MSLSLDTNIQYLKGVGPKLGSLLSKWGLSTVKDLLEFYPRAYEDRRAARSISSLNEGDIVSLKAQVVSVSSFNMGRTKRKIYDILIKDQTGQIHCKFFRVPYKGYFERFQPFQTVRVIGKITNYRGRKEFHHPDLRENVEGELEDVLVPIYTETEGLSTTKLAKLIQVALQDLAGQKEVTDQIEALPYHLREKYHLIPRFQALQLIHNPPVDEAIEYLENRSQAHQRIIFEEFFWLELLLALKRTGFEKDTSTPIQASGQLTEKLMANLPFALTNAQKKAFAEIQSDLQKSSPMHRLVQGDVGSGKTLVAFLAMAYAAEAGFQSCLMAPTEILAEQHFKNAVRLLQPLGLGVGLLTGKTKTAQRREILEKVKAKEIHILIGTHALIEDEVEFQNLALAIIDEQHRFGVEQRSRLKQKGNSPHFLVMTATPIPRSLAMTVYGDLDVSVINEMPPGRSPVQTRVAYESKRPQVMDFMLEQLKKGRQAYIIYPLVEESEKIDLKDAVSEYEKLKIQFPDVRFGLLHGKMKAEEKDQVMESFRQGETQVLVSTTVIEVGVDVPNANLIIVEHAERFGLSQLHQLRGRVGRGQHKSFCVLVLGYAVSEEGRERTQFLEKTTDGFKVAEFDLELRGPGEFLGTKQSGLPGFKAANLIRDTYLLQKAREAAFAIVKADPQLLMPDNKSLRHEILKSHGPAALASVG